MRFGGIVLVVLLSLAACSSEPAPREPSTGASSATPTTTPPTMPAQAKQDSPEGAAAFVKHYIDVFNYAAATGDVDELSRLSAPDCEGCQNYIDLISQTYAGGDRISGLEWIAGRAEVDTFKSETAVWLEISSRESQGVENYRLYLELSQPADWFVVVLERSDG